MLFNLGRQIVRDMWSHKMRSGLALFGIVWGVITVTLLLALGTGFRIASQKNMMRLVDGTFFVAPGVTSKAFNGYPQGRVVNVKSSVVVNLPKVIPGVKTVTPMLVKRTNLVNKKKQSSKEVNGVASSFAYLQKVNITRSSRFINPLDIMNKRYVVILGDQVREQLFGDINSVGRSIILNNIRFRVIGEIQKASKNVYNFYRNKAIIPYTTYIRMFGDESPQYFVVLPDADQDSTTFERNLRTYFAYKYHFSITDKNALNIVSTTQFFQFIHWFFIGIQIFLGICGALTLAVGSLGVANIMFLIVNERTREIGVRMAVGAKGWQILLQVILEALIIVGVGGVIGMGISYFTTEVLLHIQLPEWLGKPELSMTTFVVTIIILAVLGLLSGIFPARRAANMDPVEALGY